MAQQQKVRPAEAGPALAATVGEDRSGVNPWLVGGLIGMTLAFLALAGWTTYERFHRSEAERLATQAVSAWDSGRPAAFADVYDADAVVVDAGGNRIVGLDAIVAAARDRGPDFAVTQIGAATATRDGTSATISYRYTGDGHGVGTTVIEIAHGAIVRQWSFEPSATTSTAAT